jgi:hypothetical protein
MIGDMLELVLLKLKMERIPLLRLEETGIMEWCNYWWIAITVSVTDRWWVRRT